MQLNASRIQVLQAQDDVVNKMKEAAAKELLNVSRNHQVYKNLIKDLVVQVRQILLLCLLVLPFTPLFSKYLCERNLVFYQDIKKSSPNFIIDCIT